MQGETPRMMAMNYASTAYAGNDWQRPLSGHGFNDPAAEGKIQALVAQMNKQPTGVVIMANPNARRLVQVFIADPNDNIPVEQCLLYSGEQKLTDLTDQELFFEIDIKAMLAAHNEKRVKIVDKTVKERTEYLEAARVRDLKMVVATLATF